MTKAKLDRVYDRLKLSNFKLNTILDITQAINDNSKRIQLFELFQNILIDDLSIAKFVFFTYEKRWRLALKQGVSDSSVNSINIYNLVNKYNSIDVVHDKMDIGNGAFDIIIPVFHKNKPIACLLLADLYDDGMEVSPIIKHLSFIQTLANIIVVALENKRLYQEELKQLAVKKELEMAQGMQSLLFPRKLPNSSKLKVDAFYLPHGEVGGDYYDVIPLGENRTALCIADVSGKGMSAALLMANFQANLRAIIIANSDLEALAHRLNQKIIDSANFEKFITLFIAIYDSELNELNYLNAGHQPAILSHEGAITQLKSGCTILGMFDELPSVKPATVKIDKMQDLILYTDGLSEIENSNGEQLEVEGLISWLENRPKEMEVINFIEQQIMDGDLGDGISDDVTLLTALLTP